MCRGFSFRHLLPLLLLQLSKLLVVTQGKTVVLGKEGGSAELPCESTSRRSASFAWKSSDQKTILGYKNKLLIKGSLELYSRFDSRKNAWERGSFPLIINKLRMEDSQTYVCELENKKEEVELWVFRVTFNPGTRLLQGQSLTLILDSNPKVSDPPIECKHKSSNIVKDSKAFSTHSLRIQDSGIWNCTVTLNQKKHSFDMKLSVLGKRLHSLKLPHCSGIPQSALLLVPGSLEVSDGMAADPPLAEVHPEGPPRLGSASTATKKYIRGKCGKVGGESTGVLVSSSPAFTSSSGQVHTLRSTDFSKPVAASLHPELSPVGD